MVRIEGVSRDNFGCSILGNGRNKMSENFSYNYGWVCPKCLKVYGPIMKECLNCNHPEMRDPNQKRSINIDKFLENVDQIKKRMSERIKNIKESKKDTFGIETNNYGKKPL